MGNHSRMRDYSGGDCQPLRLDIPTTQFNPPEPANVPRLHEPWAGIDPRRLVWVNNPNLTTTELIEKFSITVEEAWKIVCNRARYPNGYEFRDQIPLRLEPQRKFFSINNFVHEPKKYLEVFYIQVGDTLVSEFDSLLVVEQ